MQIRNPAAPPQRRNEVTEKINVNSAVIGTKFVKAPHRDPLAQSFRVDETGAFLTSFDVYFASKDPNAKVFVELEHMELVHQQNSLFKIILSSFKSKSS